MGAAAIALATAGVGGGIGADALMRRGSSAPTEAVPAAFGGLRLLVPQAYLRQRASSGAQRLDLVLRYPELTPAIPAAAQTGALIFVAVTASDGEIDPAERAQALYGRFLEADAWQNPGGLLLRRFQAGSPYEDEELYLSPPDGRAFSARCRKRPRAGERGADMIADACLWRFRRDGADIQVRFAPELLPQWEALSAGVAGRIEAWSARAGADRRSPSP